MLNPFIIAGLIFTGLGLLQEVSNETPKLLKGPKGDAGAAGKAGEEGKKGEQGAAGKAGKVVKVDKPSDG